MLPVERFKKWPVHPGRPERQRIALLKQETNNIKIKYAHFCKSFEESFLERAKHNQFFFEQVSTTAQTLFDFDNEFIESMHSSTEMLLVNILRQQSYVNFGMLTEFIEIRGTSEDIEMAKAYKEAFRQYVNGRIFELGHETVMFLLDKTNQSISRIIDVEDFKLMLRQLLDIKHQKIILHEVGQGSAIRSYKLWDEVIHLNRWNIITSITFGNFSIVHTANAEILPATLEDGEYLALKYTGGFSSEPNAIAGYIKYLNSFLSGKYKNLPAVKGLYSCQSSDEEAHCYPTIVVESLTTLKEAASKQEVSPITQISLLSDITSSIASFESEQSVQISVFPDSVFVKKSEDPDSPITARFCPIYGHSFFNKQSCSWDQQPRPLQVALPLEKLQWMKDVVKVIHFQGNIKESAELLETHILKRIFDEKWISTEDCFRPKNFKTLSEELQHLLGKFLLLFECTITHCNNLYFRD